MIELNEKLSKEKKFKKEVSNKYKDEAIDNAVLWCLLFSVILFFIIPIIFILPIGSVAGWFFGYYYLIHKKTSVHKERIRELQREKKKLEEGQEKNAVSSLLKSGTPSSFLLLNNVLIPTRNRSFAQIDHVLICPEGSVVCVITTDVNGNYYPHKEGWKWIPNKGYMSSGDWNITDNKCVINSPQRQALFYSKLLKWFLGSHGFRDLTVYPIVVLTNTSAHWHGSHRICPVLKKDELLDYVNKHFSSHNYMQVELKEVARTVLSISEKRIKKEN